MNRQETREGLDVYPETTTIVCSEVRRSRGGSVTGIVTRLDCRAQHLQDSYSSLRSVTVNVCSRHGVVSLGILIVCCLRLL